MEFGQMVLLQELDKLISNVNTEIRIRYTLVDIHFVTYHKCAGNIIQVYIDRLSLNVA